MLRIICFAEADADARLGSGLGDRVLVEEGPVWAETDLLPSLRNWTGLDADAPFTKWTALKASGEGQVRRPRFLGHPLSGPRGSNPDVGWALTPSRTIPGRAG